MPGFAEAFEALLGLTNYETMARPPYGGRAMNLPRTRALLQELDRPERGIPCLQVAGTKGKGTAATALARILRRAGYRTGLYTSPHLFHVRERIRVDGRWITEADFADGVQEILRHVTPLRGRPECPTFFELLTVLALREFRRAGVDAAVLEVGLGGRLDATSAIRPLASLITQIGLDHTHILGRTKALIAREKAGVAKRGVPLVSGVPPRSAAGRVVAAEAETRGTPLVAVGRDFSIRTGIPVPGVGAPVTPVSVRTSWGRRVAARPSVLGRALARDAGLAATVLLLPQVRRRLPVAEETISDALGELVVPGRIQVTGERPLLVVDGAHNPDSIRVLTDTVSEALTFRRVFVILGGGRDKGVDAAARAVRARWPESRLLFTRPASHPRAADPRELARKHRASAWADDFAGGLEAVRTEAEPEDLVLVTGSLYLAGEALRHLGLAGSDR